MTAQDQAALAALYAPTVTTLTAQLPDIGDAVAGGMVTLARNPTTAAVAQVEAQLQGAVAYVRRLREAILREGGAHGR